MKLPIIILLGICFIGLAQAGSVIYYPNSSTSNFGFTQIDANASPFMWKAPNTTILSTANLNTISLRDGNPLVLQQIGQPARAGVQARIKINEDVSTITSIEYSWYGITFTGASGCYPENMYIGNINTNRWELVNATGLICSQNYMKYKLTSNIANYVNASGYVHYYVASNSTTTLVLLGMAIDEMYINVTTPENCWTKTGEGRGSVLFIPKGCVYETLRGAVK